ncbi:MAG TPA: DUF2142 domain-containing protein [Microcella sp.]|nr:DUF2142 domain-containing protein [Microcella sp.]
MSERRPLLTPSRAWLSAVALPLLMFFALASWAFASPVGSSPDDDFHLNSAWCALGERDGLCEDTDDPAVKRVPAATDSSASCFAFQPEQSAACQSLPASGELELRSTDRGNFVNQYPPVYYSVHALFASGNVEASALAMRLVNVAIFVALMTAVFAASPARLRPSVVFPSLVTLVPLGAFLIASNNPSSWAVTSAATAWVAYLGYLTTDGRRRTVLGGLAVVGALLGAGARSDSAAYTAVALVLASIVAFRPAREFVLRSLLGVVILAVMAVLNLGSRSAGVATSGFGGGEAQEFDRVGLLASNLLDLPYLWSGVFGTWGLGWLDTQMPAIVWTAMLAAFVAVAFSSQRSSSWRVRLAILALTGALVAIPSLVLVLSQAAVGEQVQPRYILPLIIMLAGSCVLDYARRENVFGRVQLIVLGAAVAGANLVALHVNIRRYVTGTDAAGWNLAQPVEWWWTGALANPLVVWMLGSLAAAGVAVLALRLVRHTPVVGEPTVAEPATAEPVADAAPGSQ